MKGKLNLPQKLGALLILFSCLILLGSEGIAAYHRHAAREIVGQIESRLPGPREGDPKNYSDAAMPVLQLGGSDFVGILEIPAFGVSLPIGNTWGRSEASRYPCRFQGSAYDSSLILGGIDKKGQLDFCGKLDLGDRIIVTDMTGTEFSYEVIRIDRRKAADSSTLTESESHLTLFARNTTSAGYIIVRCRIAP